MKKKKNFRTEEVGDAAVELDFIMDLFLTIYLKYNILCWVSSDLFIFTNSVKLILPPFKKNSRLSSLRLNISVTDQAK